MIRLIVQTTQKALSPDDKATTEFKTFDVVLPLEVEKYLTHQDVMSPRQIIGHEIIKGGSNG